MMNAILLVLVASLALCNAQAQVVTAASVTPGVVRTLTVAGTPSLSTPYGISVFGTKTSVSGGNGSGSVSFDAAKVSFCTPGVLGQSLSFYFGVLAASGTFDTSAATASVSGAFAEIAAAFFRIFIYYDNDGVPGFQYTLGNDWLCSSANQTTDCIDSNPSLTIIIQNLNWGAISSYTQPCPSGAGYLPNCTVYFFTANGTNSSGSTIMTITFKIANQGVNVNGNACGPDAAKFDITINYPWGVATPTYNNPKVGLLAGAAGKAAAANYASSSGSASFSFVGTSGYQTSLVWNNQALINNAVTATVYFSGLTSGQLQNYTCNILYPACQRIAILQTYAAIFAAFSWNTEIVWYSWTNVMPEVVYWDPSVGYSIATSASSITAVPVLAVIISLVFSYLQL